MLGNYCKLPFDILGLTLETGPSDILRFGKVLVVLTLINTNFSTVSENISQDRLSHPLLSKVA